MKRIQPQPRNHALISRMGSNIQRIGRKCLIGCNRKTQAVFVTERIARRLPEHLSLNRLRPVVFLSCRGNHQLVPRLRTPERLRAVKLHIAAVGVNLQIPLNRPARIPGIRINPVLPVLRKIISRQRRFISVCINIRADIAQRIDNQNVPVFVDNIPIQDLPMNRRDIPGRRILGPAFARLPAGKPADKPVHPRMPHPQPKVAVID